MKSFKSPVFCQSHIDRMLRSEPEAFCAWNELMRRAKIAYLNCRRETSELYFMSAVEVALIRMNVKMNYMFADSHIAKPLEFLVETYLIENNFQKAVEVLSRVSMITSNTVESLKESLLSFFQSLYEKVEISEKQLMREKTPRGKNTPATIALH